MVAARLASALGRRLQRVATLSPGITQQRRWAQVHDVRFLVTTQAPRRIAEKYREKLERKARAEGLRDADELKAAYADRIRDLKKKDNISVPGLDALLADDEPPAAPHTQRSSQTLQQQPKQQEQLQQLQQRPAPSKKTTETTTSRAAVKPLSEILDLPKARGLPVEDLTTLWRMRHSASANSLCAVIPSSTYAALERTARAHPTFVLPVPHAGQGAEIHLLQWVFDAASGTSTVLFTQLAEYKARGEWAQPHTSITHYPDYGDGADSSSSSSSSSSSTETVAKATEAEVVMGLSHKENQGVVLMSGSVVEGRGASVDDAQWLVSLLQRFYGEEGLGGDPAKRQLLAEFSKGDGNFSVQRLLEESQRLG